MNNIKSVLISIRPKWCKLIIDGIKTLEIRKSKPKLPTPFKCYIYCTAGSGKNTLNIPITDEMLLNDLIENGTMDCMNCPVGNGKVIGEFICDDIITRFPGDMVYDDKGNLREEDEFVNASCLSFDEILDYAFNGSSNNVVYGWHISELKIYDKPKELKKFFALCDMGCELCEYWTYQRVNADEFDMDCGSRVFGCKEIKRPPQSWCYVEEVEGGVL